MAMSDDCSESGTAKAPAEGQADAAREGTLLRSLFRKRGLFSSVADTALDALEAKMRPEQFGDGDVICAEGDPGGWTFVVAAGEVEVLKTAKDGAMIQVNVLRPGN
jgi:CRP-like cAMP-binding protein